MCKHETTRMTLKLYLLIRQILKLDSAYRLKSLQALMRSQSTKRKTNKQNNQ